MVFSIFFHPKAKKSFEKLDATVQERIRYKIGELRDSPEKRGEHLKHLNFWKLRVGDYRAIYEIDKQAQKVVVLFVGHRKNVYDDFSKLF